jgi:hypothetical protein
MYGYSIAFLHPCGYTAENINKMYIYANMDMIYSRAGIIITKAVK